MSRYIPHVSDSGSQGDSHEQSAQLPQEDSYYETHPDDVANASIHLGDLSFAWENPGLAESDSGSEMLTPPPDPELLRLQAVGIAAVTPVRDRFPLFESPEESPERGSNYSDVSDTDILPDLTCPICDPRRQIRIAFKECSHGACRTCTMRLWKSRWEHAEFPPYWFSCPFCRAEIHHVGVLTDGGSGNDRDALAETVERGGVEFMVKGWLCLQRWVALQNNGKKTETSTGEDMEGGGREGWAGNSP